MFKKRGAERRAGNGFKSGTPWPTGRIAGWYLNPGPPGVAVATNAPERVKGKAQ